MRAGGLLCRRSVRSTRGEERKGVARLAPPAPCHLDHPSFCGRESGEREKDSKTWFMIAARQQLPSGLAYPGSGRRFAWLIPPRDLAEIPSNRAASRCDLENRLSRKSKEFFENSPIHARWFHRSKEIIRPNSVSESERIFFYLGGLPWTAGVINPGTKPTSSRFPGILSDV